MFKKVFSIILLLCLTAAIVSGCGEDLGEPIQTETIEPVPVTNLPKTDMTKWHYNEENNLYYQLLAYYLSLLLLVKRAAVKSHLP